MTNSFKESAHIFQFSTTSWNVIKFDENPFYKTLSGRGLKGVDFLGIYKDRWLVFIEVKNYSQSNSNIPRNAFSSYIQNIEHFQHHIQRKMTDSALVVETVSSYYFDKLLYKLFYPLLKRRARKWHFWTKAAVLLDEGQFVTAVYLAVNEDDSALLASLKNAFSPTKVLTEENHSLLQRLGISVRKTK